MHRIYFDFEYRRDGAEIILGAFLPTRTGEPVLIDFRNGEGRDELAALVARYRGDAWVAHYAWADLGCLWDLGIDLSGLPTICTWTEAKMIGMSHPDTAGTLYRQKFGLLDACTAWDVADPLDPAEKEACRDLILNQETWDADEWARIERYCLSDVWLCRSLLMQLHRVLDSTLEGLVSVTADMLKRGEYVRDSLVIHKRSSGFPVDTSLMDDIYDNRVPVCTGLAQAVNEHYGADLYEIPKPNRKTGLARPPVAKTTATEALVRSLGLDDGWPMTDTGKLKMDSDTLDEMVSRHPVLRNLRETRDSIRAMSSTDLRDLLTDGWIKAPPNPWHTVTGRNGPKPREGFLLNLMPWQRSMVRPKPGWVLVGADWSQQEIAIAASLSGDEALLASYLSGDTYLAMAKRAGAVPPDATKKSHPVERQAYKAVQLGISYGKGIRSLGNDIFLDLGGRTGKPILSPEEALDKADAIYHWHRDEYDTFWSWIDDGISDASAAGYWRMTDGWMRFIDADVRYTQLLNFPIQSGGARMLRAAVRRIADTPLDMACSHHDAIYISCREEDAEAHTALLLTAMNEAAAEVVGQNVPITVDAKVYDHQGGYWDDRGTVMHARVMAEIAKAKALKSHLGHK
jgi:hypothetical protein